jgi:Kelch motif
MSAASSFARWICAATRLPISAIFLSVIGAEAQTVTPTGAMNMPRVGHQATLLLDGRVLVSGGHAGNASVAGAEIFDPVTGTWSLTGSNVTARHDHTSTLIADGRVLVVGGVSSTEACSTNATAETFDPATGDWSATPDLPIVVGTGHTATRLLDGRILVAGGGDRCGAVFETAGVFDPTSNTWTAVANMATTRQFHSAILLPTEESSLREARPAQRSTS